MKVNGQLENAGLEQIVATTTTPAYAGRMYADITSLSVAVPRFYNGTSWLQLLTAYQTTSYDILNIGLAVTVGSNALTIALKQADGATNLSAAAPGYISFRDSTLASGLYTQVSVAAAMSLVVPSSATLGMASGVSGYLWIYAINNAGTIELAISGIKYDEGTTRTSTTISAGATSISTIYSTTGRSNKAVRLLGRLNIVEAAAGTWVSLPTEIALTGNIVDAESIYAQVTSTTTAMANSGTYTALVNGTLVEDSHNGISSGIYTVRKAGRYFANAGWASTSSCTSPAIGNFWGIEIKLNSTSMLRSQQTVQTTSTISSFTAQVSGYINCALGDTIQPFGAQNIGTGTVTPTGVADANYFQIIKLP